jgi:hypothetical protein
MSNIPSINWGVQPDGSCSARYTLDASIDVNWNIFLSGTVNNDIKIQPSYMVVDNTGNIGVCYVNFGASRYSVSPYTRRTFKINHSTLFTKIEVFSGTIQVVFSDIDPGVPDEVNQYATDSFNVGAVTQSPWDASYTPPGAYPATFSNSNYTVGSPSSPYIGARSANAKTTSKFYFEVTFPPGFSTGQIVPDVFAWGFCTGDFDFTSNIGEDAAGKSVGLNENLIRYKAATIGKLTLSTFGNGAITQVRHALDLVNKKLFVCRGGSNDWNNGANDPTLPATGIDISDFFTHVLASGVYICMRFAPGTPSPPTLTLNTGQNPFNQAVPSGYAAGW